MRKRFLIPLLAALALPTAVEASIRIKPIFKNGDYVGKVKVLYKNDNYPFVFAEYPVYQYCSEAKANMWSVLAAKPKSGRTGLFGEKVPPGGMYLFKVGKASCASCRVFGARRFRNSTSRKVSQAFCTRTGQDISGSGPSSRGRADL